MLVDTDREFKQVQYKHRRAAGYTKTRLTLGSKQILCDKHQTFFINDQKISVLDLKIGDKIDSKYGPIQITNIEKFFSKRSFYTIQVFNYEGKFYLQNGITTNYG